MKVFLRGASLAIDKVLKAFLAIESGSIRGWRVKNGCCIKSEVRSGIASSRRKKKEREGKSTRIASSQVSRGSMCLRNKQITSGFWVLTFHEFQQAMFLSAELS